MSLTVLAWLAVAAYALHVVEEHMLGWYDWARKTMNISMTWEQYVITEVAILILGLTAAMLAGQPIGPMLTVAFATLLFINAIFFHIIPMLTNGGKFSPGVLTGVVLFLPLCWQVYKTQTLSQNDLFWSVAIGAAVMVWLWLLTYLKGQRYFSGAAPAKRKR
jgi:hypothetical protein